MNRLEQEFFSDPNDASAADRAHRECRFCGHSWTKFHRGADFACCPKCGRAGWREVPALSETVKRAHETLLRAARDVLIGNDECCFGQNHEGLIVAITPYLATRWRAMPDLYGMLLQIRCKRADVEHAVQMLVPLPTAT